VLPNRSDGKSGIGVQWVAISFDPCSTESSPWDTLQNSRAQDQTGIPQEAAEVAAEEKTTPQTAAEESDPQ
jgi:hypothetical protein